MNAKRLVALTEIIRGELADTNLVSALKQLVDELQNAINAPNEQSQRTVENSIRQVMQHLAKAPSNALSPGLRSDLISLKVKEQTVGELLGSGLAQQLQNVFSTGYTSVKTLDEVREIQARVAALQSAIQSADSGFTGLGLEGEQLHAGESVVGVTIPRAEVDQRLTILQRELRFFGHLLAHISECVDGKIADPTVRSLRSTDYGIDVFTTLDVAAAMALIIRGVKAVLDKVRQYGNLKRQAEDLGVDQETIDKLVEKGQKAVVTAIDEIETEIFQSCKVDDEGRVNELKAGIKLHLNGVAKRMERGFSFEVRTEISKNATDDQTNKANLVGTLSHLRFDRVDGPLLAKLPEPDESAVPNSEQKKKTTPPKKK